MSKENDHMVWSSLFDGKYTVKVTRTAPYRGELTVAAGTTVLHRKSVGLSYDALFGPDVTDVASWQEIAIKVVDNLQQPEV
jgi:hypothetical protein